MLTWCLPGRNKELAITMPSITKRLINGLKPLPDGQDIVQWDDTIPGFGIRVKPSGVISYLIQYRNKHGVSRRFTLGRHGVLTPDQARGLAKDRLADVRHGIDPAAQKGKDLGDVTIEKLCDLYLLEGPAEKPQKKASSWAIDRSNIERHIKPLLGRKHLSSLETQDVVRFQRNVTLGKSAADEKTKKRGRAIVAGGPGIAARATAVLGAALNFAVKHELRADNPAKGVKLNKLPKRERFLSRAEFGSLGDALLNAERGTTNRNAVAILRLLMLTGARKNEICGLKWGWIDFERQIIRLPDSKTGAKIIPLAEPAMEVLAALTRKNDGDWVFPAVTGKEHYQGLPRVWRRIAKAAGLKDVRLHDLRHSFASVSVSSGGSLYVLGKVLGHTQSRTTEKYAHLGDDPVRDLVNSTANTIAAALNGTDSAIPGRTHAEDRPAFMPPDLTKPDS